MIAKGRKGESNSAVFGGMSNARLGDHLRPYLATFPSPPRLVIIGNYGNGNTGDEAILAGILDEMGDLALPVVISRNPTEITRLHGAVSVRTTSLAAMREVARADVVSIGGGGLFGNGMPPLPMLLPFICLALQMLNKRVIFSAVGAYASAPRIIRSVLRLVARRSPLVTVRDPESQTVMGAGSYVVRDPAIDLVAADERDVCAVLEKVGIDLSRPVLSVSLKPAMSAELTARQDEIAFEAAQWWLENTKGQVLFLVLSAHGDFGFGAQVSDQTLSEAIRARCDQAVRVRVIGPGLHPAMMKGVVARTTAVLAHRLHAQMFAYAGQVPVVGLSYERKSDQFLSQIGAPCIQLSQPSPDDAVMWKAVFRDAVG